MKASQNQYAETLLKTVTDGAGVRSRGWRPGRGAGDSQGWGVPAAGLILRDGSGLSRYDFVTPEALVIDPRATSVATPGSADRSTPSLPIAGRDGTLSGRMKGTPAEGNARAKTGSLANVRALSGYVTTAEGERLVFSIVANNFETPADVVTAAADAIVVALAKFQRQ